MRILLFAAFVSLTLSSCFKEDCTRVMTYMKQIPVTATYDEIRQAPTLEAAREMDNPGKIYMNGDYIFVNERLEGLHIIDNSNPSAPQRVAFLKIPGNLDVAMKGNILYVDNYTDMLSIRLNSINSIELLHRQEDVFPVWHQDGDELVLGFIEEEVTEEVSCSSDPNQGVWGPWGGMANDDMELQTLGSGAGAGGRIASSGVAGSMARFAVVGEYLYALDQSRMHVFDINGTNLQRLSPVDMVWGVETIFPYRDHLFVGAANGMFIYDNQNPAQPTFVSVFQHAQACDPVFVRNDHAYVTLRGGTPCQNFVNQLDIIDISNIHNPTLVASHAMNNPHGLSVVENTLYLCDGNAGLKVFDVSSHTNIEQLYHYASMSAYDVIAMPQRNIIFAIGADGLFQFDSSDPSNLVLLSQIEVAPEAE